MLTSADLKEIVNTVAEYAVLLKTSGLPKEHIGPLLISFQQTLMIPKLALPSTTKDLDQH